MAQKTFASIAVIGAGAFGTALAFAADRAGARVSLWGRDPVKVATMAATRLNPRLPGHALPPAIVVTADLAEAVSADALILAVPTQALRETVSGLAGLNTGGRPLIVAAKGIERATGLFVTDVVHSVLPNAPVAMLSGPGFAADIAGGFPAALTLAATDAALGKQLAEALASPAFRIYASTDLRGVEIGGAAKNVLAIAAGIAAGKGFGESTIAALIARSFAELTRFGVAHGARAETLAGLSGLGDLILTGMSSRSRNRRLGEELGRGATLAAAIESTGLAEGVWTAPILAEMAAQKGVEMPVAQAVADFVDGRTSVDRAIEVLLARPVKGE
jgi:glycerol-3-phosphate dehydrogenase (NAD(P)+)